MNEPSPITTSEAPRFCTDCGRAAPGAWGSGLCGHCGGTLALQGYCPICEGRVRRRVGEPCPKHDVELIADEPAPHPIHQDGSVGPWVTVRRFPDSLAASAARIRLDAEGIPTFVEGERMGAPAMYRVATGGVKLQVPEEYAADARIILSQDWSWPGDELAIDEDAATDVDEVGASDAPSPRSFLVEIIVVLALAIPLIAALIAHLSGD